MQATVSSKARHGRRRQVPARLAMQAKAKARHGRRRQVPACLAMQATAKAMTRAQQTKASSCSLGDAGNGKGNDTGTADKG
eukprot:1136689-Pelagomonas_calceolata.AAC.3